MEDSFFVVKNFCVRKKLNNDFTDFRTQRIQVHFALGLKTLNKSAKRNLYTFHYKINMNINYIRNMAIPRKIFLLNLHKLNFDENRQIHSNINKK